MQIVTNLTVVSLAGSHDEFFNFRCIYLKRQPGGHADPMTYVMTCIHVCASGLCNVTIINSAGLDRGSVQLFIYIFFCIGCLNKHVLIELGKKKHLN